MGNQWKRAIAVSALTMWLLPGGLACGSHPVSSTSGPGQRTVIPAPGESGPIVAALAVITSIRPSGGPPGTRVTLTGPDLNAVVTVCFGPRAATGIRNASGTQLSAVVPPGTGRVPVIVITRSKVLGGVSFTYSPSSTVIPTAPRSAACDGGSAAPEPSP